MNLRQDGVVSSFGLGDLLPWLWAYVLPTRYLFEHQ